MSSNRAKIDKSKLYQFIEGHGQPVSKREICRVFGVKGQGRIPLKSMLKDLEKEGSITFRGGSYSLPVISSKVMAKVAHIDENGDCVAYPVEAINDESKKKIVIFSKGGRQRGHSKIHDIKVGDVIFVSCEPLGKDTLEGQVLSKKEERPKEEFIGELTSTRRGGYYIEPANRKMPSRIEIDPQFIGDAKKGDLVLADLHRSRQIRGMSARITSVLGRADDPRLYSHIAQVDHEIPNEFPAECQRLAEAAELPSLQGREDLREIPLVTIDGADAKDFDDAVFAKPTKNGWDAIVAIADVAYYVRPHNPLDQEAFKRGNSVYFPNRVIPMLPEGLSNNMCSLVPQQDRACLAVHLQIDKNGQMTGHRFVRGLMRSHARLTYEQVQESIDGDNKEFDQSFMDTVIHPLYGVFKALKKARDNRGTIDLNIPEYAPVFAEDGHVEAIKKRERVDSHMLIEELMIIANVAAAEALEAKKAPAMYRIHSQPDPERMAGVVQMLQKAGKGKITTADVSHKAVNHLLSQAKGLPEEDLINKMVLRSMSQAQYNPENIGHYGLNLELYCHFTSPIRRYSDLLVHRSLVQAYGLGEGELERPDLEPFADHISNTERRAMLAERDTMDRYMAAYIGSHESTNFSGSIVGVGKMGLFVMLGDTGATGYLPVKNIQDDYYRFDEVHKFLKGRRKGRIFKIGQDIDVHVVSTHALSGRIEIEMQG